MSENYSKCRILNFWILAFSTNFCPFNSDLSANTVWQQTYVFENSSKSTILASFWKPDATFEQYYQTGLIMKGQKLVKIAKIEKFKMRYFE